ncbi:uncharacterized protein LOC123426523 isoform X2 [Hordeum vulgare subsp. vulgare]|uniref:uncharacterized protein LOC123426523 isoform X2 n=1 Tax=Hordeum vulgare subsp. vulgare TaxID=112509 RepID=UPI001D1A4CD4|nr:uncharacterized protein LOC123426523 isoform X2 [Hordeum vulgare subsp. vulgare]
MDLTPHSFVTSRASGRLLNVVHCSRRITCQNLLFITCFYQSSSAPSAKHWDSLHQAIPGRAPQHAGSGCRAAWNQGGLSQMVLRSAMLQGQAVQLE